MTHNTSIAIYYIIFICYNFRLVVLFMSHHCRYTIHIPSLSLPSCFKTPISFKIEISRSMVRWLTDNVSDICLLVTVGDSFYEIPYFLMTLREFRLRHVSVMVSDILCVGNSIDNGLKLGWGGFEYRF